MTLDTTINLGHIVTLVGILITFVTWGSGVKWQVNLIEARLKLVEEELKKITQLLITTSNLEVRLAHLETRISEFERRSIDSR